MTLTPSENHRTTEPTADVAGDEAPSRAGRRWVRLAFGRQGSVRRPIGFFIVAVIVATIVAPSFIRPANVSSVLVGNSFLVVVSVGEAFVILIGSIDLGVQSLLASFGMAAAWLIVFHHVPASVALVATLIGSLAIGAVVGLLVAKVHIPSFVVTLGTYWGFQGIALLANGGQYISPASGTPPRQEFGFEWVANSTAGVSNLIIVMVVVVIIGQCVVSFTRFGLHLRSIGSNELAARRVGLSADWLKVSAFVISAFLAAVAGIMITAWQGSIYPNTANGYSLEAIAAVILGGIPFTGGRGSIVGVAIGALILGIINDIIVLIGLPALYEYIFVAVVLVIAGLQARAGRLVK